MKIEVRLDENEKWETPIAFAEAVINHFMENCFTLEDALMERRNLGEVTHYLSVFCEHHPRECYEVKNHVET